MNTFLSRNCLAHPRRYNSLTLGTGNYSATANNMKLAHWRWVGCYIWYSEAGPGRAAAAPSPSSLYQM